MFNIPERFSPQNPELDSKAETRILLRGVLKKHFSRSGYTLQDINFSFKRGENIGIIGRSGSGKSTLLNILGMLDDAAGEYVFQCQEEGALKEYSVFESRNKSHLRRKLGFVFQTPFMLSNFSVYYNIALPLIIREEPLIVKDDHGVSVNRVEKMLRELDLLGHANDTADKLSGGQRQRVAIGRALIHEPHIVFADEPTGSLDIRTTREVMGFFRKVCDDVNASLVLITHDPKLALDYCDRIIGIKNSKIAFDLSRIDLCLEDLTYFIEMDGVPGVDRG